MKYFNSNSEKKEKTSSSLLCLNFSAFGFLFTKQSKTTFLIFSAKNTSSQLKLSIYPFNENL